MKNFIDDRPPDLTMILCVLDSMTGMGAGIISFSPSRSRLTSPAALQTRSALFFETKDFFFSLVAKLNNKNNDCIQ